MFFFIVVYFYVYWGNEMPPKKVIAVGGLVQLVNSTKLLYFFSLFTRWFIGELSAKTVFLNFAGKFLNVEFIFGGWQFMSG